MNTLKELNVLYVEDEEFVAQSMTRLLSLQFKEVTHKENGKTALEEFLSNQDKYNLIITDLRMPVMHGIDMIKEIKKVDSLIPRLFRVLCQILIVE